MRRTWTLGWVAMIGLAFAPAARAADGPVDSLLKAVPADVGGVVICQDLAGLWDRFQAGPVWAKIKSHPLYAKWTSSPGYAKFQQDKAKLDEVFGDMETLLKTAAGNGMVLAFSPADDGKGRGVLLSWVSDVETFRTALGKIEEIQREKGELLRVTDKTVGPVSYRESVVLDKSKTEKTHYWAIAGNRFVITDCEPLLRDVLVLSQGGGAGSLAADARFKETLASLPAGASVKAYLNPRRFDSVVQAGLAKGAAQGDPGGRFIARVIQASWPAVKSLAASLDFKGGAALRLHVAVDEAKLPAPMRAWRKTAMQSPALWKAMPADPMAVLIGRVDIASLMQILEAYGDEKAQRGAMQFRRLCQAVFQEKDVNRDVLANIGPDVAVVVTCPKGEDGRSGVPRLTAALRVGGQSSQVRTAISTVIEGFMRAALMNPKLQQDQPPLIQSVAAGPNATVRHLPHVKSWPEGVMPGYALCGEYLLVGSNKDELVSMAKRMSGSAADGAFARTRAQRFPNAQHAVYVDLKQVQAALRTHRRWLAANEAKKGKKTREQIDRDHDNLLMILDLVDALYWTRTLTPGRTDHAVGLTARAR